MGFFESIQNGWKSVSGQAAKAWGFVKAHSRDIVNGIEKYSGNVHDLFRSHPVGVAAGFIRDGARLVGRVMDWWGSGSVDRPPPIQEE